MYINNKGQSLVMFIVFIPIFLILAGLVIDIGIANNEKIRLNNTNITAIEYALDNYNEKMIIENIIENEPGILVDDITIEKDGTKIYITLVKHVDSIFTRVINIFDYKIESVYEGEYINDRKIVRKVKSGKI